MRKSHLVPTTHLEFLGFILDTKKFHITLSERKKCSIKKKLVHIVHNPHKKITVRRLSQIIGILVATFPCTDEGKLHYRHLERLKVKHLCLQRGKWDSYINLNTTCYQEICWWYAHLDTPKMIKSLAPIQHTEEIGCDACKDQFGGWWRDKTIASKFLEKHIALSINAKELLAIYFTLAAFVKELRGSILKIFSDNTTAMQCIKKFGSKDPFRDRLTRKIFDLAYSNGIQLMCEWLNTSDNFFG